MRRVDLRSVLSLFDVESGEIRSLWDGLDEDQQETWSLFGVYPGFAWTPNGRALVIWARGRLWRVDARSGEAEVRIGDEHHKAVIGAMLGEHCELGDNVIISPGVVVGNWVRVKGLKLLEANIPDEALVI